MVRSSFEPGTPSPALRSGRPSDLVQASSDLYGPAVAALALLRE
jgi:hypothetical protein